MPEKTFNGQTVEVDAEGYMVDNAQWNEGIAADIAKELGIELTDDHWKVINFIIAENKESGNIPTLRSIGKKSGVDMKGLYKLFPDGPVKKAAMIAGLPKPKSCV
ncbi:TusE/DsrC/DsvC family sulfur relay protein [Candidatus Latescibacterota bacterium]